MAVINTGTLPKLGWPGLQEVFGMTYRAHPKTYTKMFATVKSDKMYEEYQNVTGFPIARLKQQGASIEFVAQQQGPTTRLTNATFGLGCIVTEEEMEDNLYPKVTTGRVASLAFSMAQYSEETGALVYNRAFTAGYIGGDGVTLCNTAHPNAVSGTQSNTFVVGADLSETAYEDALIQIAGWTDDQGLKIDVHPLQLIVPRQLKYDAIRLTRSTYQPGTANNDVNATLYDNSVPEGSLVSVYLTGPKTWFIRTDAGGMGGAKGMIYQERTGIKFFEDNEFDTRNKKYGSSKRETFGWDSWLGLFGSAGP